MLIVEGVLTGEVCHIKAASPEGPRYDPSQTADQRHGFDNLLILCQPHHSVIDADDVAYTVERLMTMKQQHELCTHTQASPETAVLFVSAVLGSSITGDVTNIRNLNVYQVPVAPPPMHPDLRIGFASTFLMALQPTPTLGAFAGNSTGFYIRRDDSVSIRTDNLEPVTARQLSWSYVLPAGVPVWSGPNYDGLVANIGARWVYQQTCLGVTADGLNPGSAMIHHFNIGMPTDGRRELPIDVTVGMVDGLPVSVRLVAHIPDVVAEVWARRDQPANA